MKILNDKEKLRHESLPKFGQRKAVITIKISFVITKKRKREKLQKLKKPLKIMFLSFES